MVFGMINSFLVVCFTMVQNIFKSENIYKILTKISHNGYKTTFKEECIIFYNEYKRKFSNNSPAILIN